MSFYDDFNAGRENARKRRADDRAELLINETDAQRRRAEAAYFGGDLEGASRALAPTNPAFEAYQAPAAAARTSAYNRAQAERVNAGDYAGFRAAAQSPDEVLAGKKLGDQEAGKKLSLSVYGLDAIASAPEAQREQEWLNWVDTYARAAGPEVQPLVDRLNTMPMRNRLGTARNIILQTARNMGVEIPKTDPRKLGELNLGNRVQIYDTETGDPVRTENVGVNPTTAVQMAGAGSGANRKGETDLRKEFEKGQGDFVTVRDAYSQVESLGNGRRDAAGDIAFIFSYMKMLDPGSVVREGEFANAQNAAGVPDQVANLYNRALRGQRLNPNQVQQFVGQARTIYEARKRQFDRDAAQYRSFAEDYGFDPDRVVRDLGYAGAAGAAEPAPGRGRPATDLSDDDLVNKYAPR